MKIDARAEIVRFNKLRVGDIVWFNSRVPSYFAVVGKRYIVVEVRSDGFVCVRRALCDDLPIGYFSQSVFKRVSSAALGPLGSQSTNLY